MESKIDPFQFLATDETKINVFKFHEEEEDVSKFQEEEEDDLESREGDETYEPQLPWRGETDESGHETLYYKGVVKKWGKDDMCLIHPLPPWRQPVKDSRYTDESKCKPNPRAKRQIKSDENAELRLGQSVWFCSKPKEQDQLEYEIFGICYKGREPGKPIDYTK